MSLITSLMPTVGDALVSYAYIGSVTGHVTTGPERKKKAV